SKSDTKTETVSQTRSKVVSIGTPEESPSPESIASGHVTSNGEVEGPPRSARLEPRVHTVFQHPRRHYRASRTPPTIVRSHDPSSSNRLTRQKDTHPLRRPFETNTARHHIGVRARIDGAPGPVSLEFPDSNSARFLPDHGVNDS